MSKAATSLIQTGLRELRYQPGMIDGIFGAKTRAAAMAWLEQAGAPAEAVVVPQPSGRMFQGKARYPIGEIVVHCSATRPSWMAKASFADQVAEVRRWHMQDRGWKDIGYHWLISRDGKLMPGRAETVIGAGVDAAAPPRSPGGQQPVHRRRGCREPGRHHWPCPRRQRTAPSSSCPGVRPRSRTAMPQASTASWSRCSSSPRS